MKKSLLTSAEINIKFTVYIAPEDRINEFAPGWTMRFHTEYSGVHGYVFSRTHFIELVCEHGRVLVLDGDWNFYCGA